MKYILTLGLFGLICLTGCVSTVITQIEPDSTVANLPIADRYQRYQKESLGFVGKTIIDGQGNTLSVDEFKKILTDKNDVEALNEYSENLKKVGTVALLFTASAYNWFWLANKSLDNNTAFVAIAPYAGLSLGFALGSYEFLFSSSHREGVNTKHAVDKYNDHLRQRLGLESPRRYNRLF